jgi:hypothetical protein
LERMVNQHKAVLKEACMLHSRSMPGRFTP